MGTSHTLRRSVAGDWRQGKICFHRGEVMTLFHLRARRAVLPASPGLVQTKTSLNLGPMMSTTQTQG